MTDQSRTRQHGDGFLAMCLSVLAALRKRSRPTVEWSGPTPGEVKGCPVCGLGPYHQPPVRCDDQLEEPRYMADRDDDWSTTRSHRAIMEGQ